MFGGTSQTGGQKNFTPVLPERTLLILRSKIHYDPIGTPAFLRDTLRTMNVLLMTFDDLRGDFGMADLPDRVIPNIRRLQKRAMTFTEAHTPCAICAPGRACLFTGLLPDTHGVTTLKQKLRGKLPDVLTWPQYLRQQGWHSMRSGKIYHKGVPDCLVGLGDGDDDPHSWDQKFNPPGYELHSNGAYTNATPWETHTAGTGGAIAWLRAEKGDEKQHDYRMATDIVDAIHAHTGDQPQLWAAGFIRPHVPFVAPKEYFEAVDDLDIPLPEVPADATSIPSQIRSQWCGNWGLSEDQRREAIRAYLATLMYADKQVGRMLDALEESGHAEQTVILLTADHGFQLGEHGLWFKNFLYRESTHIPMILADPRQPDSHGKSCASLVDQTDVFPTLVDLLDLPSPDVDFEGHSLAPLLQAPETEVREILHTQVDWGPQQGRAKRTRDQLHITWTGSVNQTQLFDLTRDPGEHVDLLHQAT